MITTETNVIVIDVVEPDTAHCYVRGVTDAGGERLMSAYRQGRTWSVETYADMVADVETLTGTSIPVIARRLARHYRVTGYAVVTIETTGRTPEKAETIALPAIPKGKGRKGTAPEVTPEPLPESDLAPAVLPVHSGHRVSEADGCDNILCDGSPTPDMVTSNVGTIPADPYPGEYGVETAGRELSEAVAIRLGVELSDVGPVEYADMDTRGMGEGRSVTRYSMTVKGHRIDVILWETSRGMCWPYASLWVDGFAVERGIDRSSGKGANAVLYPLSVHWRMIDPADPFAPADAVNGVPAGATLTPVRVPDLRPGDVIRSFWYYGAHSTVTERPSLGQWGRYSYATDAGSQGGQKDDFVIVIRTPDTAPADVDPVAVTDTADTADTAPAVDWATLPMGEARSAGYAAAQLEIARRELPAERVYPRGTPVTLVRADGRGTIRGIVEHYTRAGHYAVKDRQGYGTTYAHIDQLTVEPADSATVTAPAVPAENAVTAPAAPEASDTADTAGTGDSVDVDPVATVTAPAVRMAYGTRGPIRESAPSREGDGSSRSWRRDINGTPYAFTAVTMPSGERRYSVSRYNGYCADSDGRPTENALSFGCAWSPAHFITVAAPAVPADPWPTVEPLPFPGVADVDPVTRADRRPRVETYRGRRIRVERAAAYGTVNVLINGVHAYVMTHGTDPDALNRAVVDARRTIDGADIRRVTDPEAYPAHYFAGAPEANPLWVAMIRARADIERADRAAIAAPDTAPADTADTDTDTDTDTAEAAPVTDTDTADSVTAPAENAVTAPADPAPAVATAPAVPAFTVDRATLAEALAYAAPGRTYTPILSYVLLTADSDGVRVLAHDTETCREYRMRGTVATQGATLLPGKLFAEIVKAAKGSTVTVTPEAGTAKVAVASGRRRYMVPTLCVLDYPAAPEAAPLAGSVPVTRFADAVARVAVAAGRDDTLPVLTGLHMYADGGQLKLSATDRYRLHVADVPWSGDPVAMLPEARPFADALKTFAGAVNAAAKAAGAAAHAAAKDDPGNGKGKELTAAAKAAREGAENLTRYGASLIIGHTPATEGTPFVPAKDGRPAVPRVPGEPGWITLVSGPYTYTARVLDGEFPKIRALLPDGYAARVSVTAAELSETVDAVAIVAERATPVRLTVTGDTVTVRAGGVEDATAEETMPCTVETSTFRDDNGDTRALSAGFTQAFNHAYLLDSLKAVGTDRVIIDVTEPKKPAVIRPVDSPAGAYAVTALCMPVRIGGGGEPDAPAAPEVPVTAPAENAVTAPAAEAPADTADDGGTADSVDVDPVDVPDTAPADDTADDTDTAPADTAPAADSSDDTDPREETTVTDTDTAPAVELITDQNAVNARTTDAFTAFQAGRYADALALLADVDPAARVNGNGTPVSKMIAAIRAAEAQHAAPAAEAPAAPAENVDTATEAEADTDTATDPGTGDSVDVDPVAVPDTADDTAPADVDPAPEAEAPADVDPVRVALSGYQRPAAPAELSAAELSAVEAPSADPVDAVAVAAAEAAAIAAITAEAGGLDALAAATVAAPAADVDGGLPYRLPAGMPVKAELTTVRKALYAANVGGQFAERAGVAQDPRLKGIRFHVLPVKGKAGAFTVKREDGTAVTGDVADAVHTVVTAVTVTVVADPVTA